MSQVPHLAPVFEGWPHIFWNPPYRRDSTLKKHRTVAILFLHGAILEGMLMILVEKSMGY